MLYNIPGRCGIEIGVEVVRRLAADCPNIVSRSRRRAGRRSASARCGRFCRADFTILSGDDSLTLPFMAVGAVGVVSVASNVIPAEVVALVKHFTDGQALAARVLHQAYYPIFKEIFVEPNPVPIKLALLWKGIIASAEVRLPLCEASRENSDRLRALLVSAKVL